MKKIYNAPVVKEIKVRMEQQICAGSPNSLVGGTMDENGNDTDDSTNNLAKDLEDILDWID